MQKKLAGLLSIFVLLAAMTIAVSTSAQAQTTYSVCNNTAVTVLACVQIDCGGTLILLPCSSIPGGGPPYECTIWTIPAGCTVSGVVLNGRLYPMGYSGTIPPPNPPNGITVSASGAIIW